MLLSDSEVTWEFLLAAYANGYFPMADTKDSPILQWMYPEMRGILPLDTFHTPKSLAKFIKKSPFVITTNTAFPQVIRACADVSEERKETWINEEIIKLYCELWENGYAHSVECWQGSELVGGLYGVAIGGAFFGESMFSKTSNASKVALVHLVELLKNAGYTLLDAQFTNEHLKQFGIIEIPRNNYLKKLAQAISITPEKYFNHPRRPEDC
ncbi:MAG: leucyl/phenylalanyl-tRNA--protein transferase [Rickettsiales bacterium]